MASAADASVSIATRDWAGAAPAGVTAGPPAPDAVAVERADGAGFLDCRAIEKTFGATPVLTGIDLGVRPGELVSLLGPSGCGKTTLLRVIAGLVRPDRGSVCLGGRDLTRVPPHRRHVGVVFQSYALFPHLSVAQNVAFGLKARRQPRARVAEGVARALDLIRLAELADRPITALSGGQQQRVAVARALAIEPKLLLLDEPFSALDRKLREGMQIDLRRLLRELAITALFVTHDQDEAFMMSDRIALMNRGEIEQLAVPGELYRRPATAFALGFVGQSVMLRGVVRRAASGLVEIETGVGMVRAPASYRPGSPVIVGVRPEQVRSVAADAPVSDATNAITARLLDRVYMGSKQQLLFATPEGERLMSEVSSAEPIAAGDGDRHHLQWAISDTMVYPATDGSAA